MDAGDDRGGDKRPERRRRSTRGRRGTAGVGLGSRVDRRRNCFSGAGLGCAGRGAETGVITLTLHKVRDGNAKTTDIPLDEFDRY